MAYEYRCKDCTERHAGCHAACEKYAEDKAKHDKLKREERVKNLAKTYTYSNVGKVLDNQAKRRKSNAGRMWFRKG